MFFSPQPASLGRLTPKNRPDSANDPGCESWSIAWAGIVSQHGPVLFTHGNAGCSVVLDNTSGGSWAAVVPALRGCGGPLVLPKSCHRGLDK
jgi:hypothetical protein